MQTLVETKIYFESKEGMVRDSILEDIHILSKNLRNEDKTEIWYSHHKIPEEALFEGFKNSVICLTVERNSQPIIIFGIVPITILGNMATIWMLASDKIRYIPKSFAKHSRKFINMFLGYYPYLENWVSCANTKSIEWLKYLGATIGKPEIYGIEKQFFRHFYFKRSY